MSSASLCGLGQRTPGPVMAALRFFEEEFLAHIDDKMCPAGQCKPLVRAKCINACPAGVDTPAYLALVAQGKYEEGLAVHRERNPFALICGRVCPAFCEQKCRRGDIDEPIAVRLVKRFMADHECERPGRPSITGAAKEERVAVVGGGPAGLTAALRLAQCGYKVTVFEKLPVPGGMMTVGIPEYRLPRELLFAEIENIQRAGVEIQCNMALGGDFTVDDLFDREGFKAVVLAIGAHKSRRLGIPGEEKQGVIHGTDFLRDVALANRANPAAVRSDPSAAVRGKRVAVVGGGDVAIDAARTAWRLGAKRCTSSTGAAARHARARRRDRGRRARGHPVPLPGQPGRVLGDDHLTGVVFSASAWAISTTAAGAGLSPSRATSYAGRGLLIPAIGQMTDLSWMHEDGIEATRSSTFTGEGSLQHHPARRVCRRRRGQRTGDGHPGCRSGQPGGCGGGSLVADRRVRPPGL